VIKRNPRCGRAIEETRSRLARLKARAERPAPQSIVVKEGTP
jgi:hypothetical protein